MCAVLGLVMLTCGWLIPAHLRAVDVGVLGRAGKGTPPLIQRGIDLAVAEQLGAAQLISKAATAEKIQGDTVLTGVVHQITDQHPAWEVWGSPAPGFAQLFGTGSTNSQPFTDYIVQIENRQKALDFLGKSQRSTVVELLQCRQLDRLAIFAPSKSSAGQAFDTAIAVGGLLSEQGKLTPSLNSAIAVLAAQANRTGHSEPLEQALLDLLSLGRRMNWNQLETFVAPIQDVATLHVLSGRVRQAGDNLPELFAAVDLTGEPSAVAHYLTDYSKTGVQDLGESLRYGAGGVKELLQRDERLYSSPLRQYAALYNPFGAFFYFTLDYCWRVPWLALIVKWLFYLGGGFLIAVAMHFARPAVTDLEKPLEVRGFHLAREALFALGFLLVMLLVTEPFLSQDSQQAKPELPFRLHVPTVSAVVHAGITDAKSSFMNQSNLLIMLLFFVLQGLLYTACVVKLAEIRRQRVGPRIKLKLLENEEHLFDAGLYLGFLGTIVSFIVYSMFAHHQFSLMVAYSSTSFGILYVSFFKIFHLRPVRRRLLLEAEASPSDTMMPAGTPTLA